MRPRIDRRYVLGLKRVRIMEGTCRAVAEHGVDGAKLADLVREGGVGTRTFYEIFTGTDDCFEQTLSWISGSVQHDALEAINDSGEGVEAVTRSAIAAVLQFVADHPERARFYLIDGPRISLAIFDAEQEAIGGFFVGERKTADMVAGGITWALRQHLLERRDEDPRDLLEDLVAFVLNAPRPRSQRREALAAA